VFQEYGTDLGDLNWYACAQCAGIVDAEAWEELIERNFAAHARIAPIPKADEPMLRAQAEHLVRAFRALRLVAA